MSPRKTEIALSQFFRRQREQVAALAKEMRLIVEARVEREASPPGGGVVVLVSNCRKRTMRA